MVQQKILLLLLSGLAMGLTRSPRTYFRIAKNIPEEWKKINKRNLREAIKRLYKSKLIFLNEDEKGNFKMILTKEGKKKALVYNLNTIKIKAPEKWDKKWRVVIFDIPEKKRQARDAIRFHLKQLGFCELQKSVFVFPFDCKNEVEFLVEFYGIVRFVRILFVDSIDNQLHLKTIFKLK